MTDRPRAGYTTEDGLERIFVTAILDGQLFDRLERWRFNLSVPSTLNGERQISRSEALRLLLDQHLPQLPSITNVSDS